MRTVGFALLAGLVVSLASSATAGPALEGKCPVCLYEMGKAMPGKADHQVVRDRKVFYFPGEAQKKMFLGNPDKYTPALGGDCTVCFAEMGVRMPGKAEFSTKHDGRLYLFPGEAQLQTFKANPEKYANVDQPYLCFCAVCLLNAKKLVEGKPEFASTYDGFRFLFPDAGTKATFDSDPARYVPALGGKCAVCLKDGGKSVLGKMAYGAYYGGRIYLFPEEGARKKFIATPAHYGGLDIANRGNCIVCQKMMGKVMPGKREFSSVYKGKLYLFPGAKQREMFESEPEKFLSGPKPLPVPPKGSTPAPVVPPARGGFDVNITGKTACAGCEFGVKPIADPNSLGIAVVTPEKVYVVDQGESRYPGIYDKRFDGLRVRLQGKVKKQTGKFVWVEASALQQVQ